MIVKYRRLYPIGPYLNEEIGFETSISDDGDAMAELETLRSLCDDAHKKLNPGLELSINSEYSHLLQNHPSIPETQVERTPKDKAIDAQIITINSYSDKAKLETFFKSMVERANEPRLTEAYELKLKSLQ